MALKATPFRRAEDPTKVYLDVNIGQGSQPQKTFELSQEALQGLGYTPQEVETRYNQPIYGESGQLTSTEQLRSLFSGQRVGTKGEKGLENIFDIGATGATAYQAPQQGYVPGGVLDIDPRLFSILTGQTKQFGTTPVSGLTPVEQPTAYQQAFQQGKQAGLTPEQISQQYAQQQQALSGGFVGTTPPTQPTQPTVQPMQPTQPQAQSGEELSKSGQYYKVGNDVFDQSGRKLELPEFKQLGLNFALLPEKGQAGQAGQAGQPGQVGQQAGQETGQPGQDGQEYFKKLAPGGGYYDVFDQSGRKITQEEFQSKGLNAEHIPEITSGTATDTTKSDTDVMNTFNGITDKDLFGNNKSVTDVVKEISTAFGLTDINAEIQKVDDQFAEDAKDINTNPWISEGMRSKQLTALQSKYENKKNALVDRLKLQSDVVGKAIDYWQKEREYKKDLLFKQLDMASKTLDEKKYGPGSIGEYQFYVEQEQAAGRQPMGYNEYQTMDINRKAKATAAVNTYGLDAKQTQNFLRISDNFQKDEIIKNGDKSVSTIAIADQVLANPSKASNQLKALYTLVKALDPDSAVREGEISLAQQTQSYLSRFQSSLERVYQGQVIAPEVAKELAIATKELASTWQDAATRRTQKYKSQANVAGVGDAFGTYLQGSVITPTITSAPQAPTYKQVEGVPEDISNAIQEDLNAGFSLEDIRQNLAKELGREIGYNYLDLYMSQ